MYIINTKFEKLKIIQQKKFQDSRGSLRETFRKKIIKWDNLIFDYVTVSKKNVLRGFHFNSKFPQAKFVTVLKGKILDKKGIINLGGQANTVYNFAKKYNPKVKKEFNKKNSLNSYPSKPFMNLSKLKKIIK